MSGNGEYRRLSDLRALAPGRFDRASQPHLFDRLDWIETLHSHCMTDNAPRALYAASGDEEAWLFLADGDARRRMALANWYSFAFRPVFVGDPADGQRVILLERIARALAQETAEISLYPVPADDGARDALLDAFRKGGWLTIARPMGINHRLHVDGRDFATYWAQRPGALRTLVRRKGRGDPFTLDLHDRLSDAVWDDYVSVYRRSWKQEEPDYGFLRAIAERESAAGTLRIGLARRHGVAVAAQLWTVENGAALIHKLAHDSAHDGASPGTLLSHFMFRHAIDTDRVDLIDYGTGDNPYKSQWMDSHRPLFRIDCFNPRFAQAWLPAARTAISKLVG